MVKFNQKPRSSYLEQNTRISINKFRMIKDYKVLPPVVEANVKLSFQGFHAKSGDRLNVKGVFEIKLQLTLVCLNFR